MSIIRSRIVITGLKGGSGKTTVTLGLLRSFRREGRHIRPFKKGPDYIDAGWLSAAAGTECYNLDTFIVHKEETLRSFIVNSEGVDASIVEGNRGVFDGMDRDGTYSTAALARLIDSPLILIADCKKTAATIGVIVKGINEFDPSIRFAGVILNHVATARQERVIREAVEHYSNLPVVGALRVRGEPLVPERHMGLLSSHEYSDLDAGIERIADIVSESVDCKAIWRIMQDAAPMDPARVSARSSLETCARIGVIRDRAFQFYYPDNIRSIMDSGGEIVGINALDDSVLPDIDALYIGGGFPETNSIALSKNHKFMSGLKDVIESGLPVYAECGGLMFLGRSICYRGVKYPMAGIFPFDFEVSDRPMAHGYTVVETISENPFHSKGEVIRGHEFHYSYVSNTDCSGVNYAFKMVRGKGILNGLDGAVYKNVFATYTHIHSLGTPNWPANLVAAAKLYSK